VHLHTHDRAAGFLQLARARVRWFLSISADTLPEEVKAKGGRTFRSITVDGQELEFSEGFTDLHTLSYRDILRGEGFSLDDARPAVVMAHDIRNASPIGLTADAHPFAALPTSIHPFLA
jgi:UDP-N-acetyl-2-amino-2-deoxyglucuronate dehydrogenase